MSLVTFASCLADALDPPPPPPPPPRRFATPGALAKYCDPTTLQTPALDLIDAAVVAIMDGIVTRQQLAAPPQIGKSERVARWTPLWMLCCDPTLRIAVVSAENELARRWGRQIKRDLEANPDLGLTLMADSKAAGRWETAQGGGLYCTGVLAGTTGRPVDVLIIDDPVITRGAAESAVQRERVWEFWENDGAVRARKAILMATRWHVDDLAGRLQEREPGKWALLSMPAIATEPDDALGRQVGEEILSANPKLHGPGYYLAEQKARSPYVWSSLFQQHPTVGEGNMFKRGDWRFWTWHTEAEQITLDGAIHDLRDATKFITMDLAVSTKTSADYTVAGCWAITAAGDLVLLDRVRERVPEVDHAALIAPLRQRWMGPYDVTYIERLTFQSTLAYALNAAGVPVAEVRPDADKQTRAFPYAGLVRQHKVWLPANAVWLDEWLDEHADFPKTTHDDQVDVGAYAARVTIAHWQPALSEGVTRAAAKHEAGYVDLMTAKW